MTLTIHPNESNPHRTCCFSRKDQPHALDCNLRIQTKHENIQPSPVDVRVLTLAQVRAERESQLARDIRVLERVEAERVNRFAHGMAMGYTVSPRGEDALAGQLDDTKDTELVNVSRRLYDKLHLLQHVLGHESIGDVIESLLPTVKESD